MKILVLSDSHSALRFMRDSMDAVKPDAVVTGNVKDFALSDFPVFDCDGLFEWIRSKDGVSYCEIAFE